MITASAQERKKPNIVFMMADNLGYGDLGCYGGGEVRGMPTPRIDQLSREGLRFTQFLVEPGCTPSRAAAMTGRYSIRCGLSLVVLRGSPNTLQAKEVTLAEILKDAGYATAMFGKWHLGMEPQSQPHNQGFDEYYGILAASFRCDRPRRAPRRHGTVASRKCRSTAAWKSSCRPGGFDTAPATRAAPPGPTGGN